jgi:3'-phosphoadenosine 5'-phosphosulfate sulfotransferase (PAPS reductase)/FAD synthetase
MTMLNVFGDEVDYSGEKLENITTFDFTDLERFRKIFISVSGGIDSTYLFEYISSLYPDKVVPVNCWNPYETNQTVKDINRQCPCMISIRPKVGVKFREVLEKSFAKLPEAMKLRKEGRYHKKVFGCCRVFKHEMFEKDLSFVEDDTVVISGIKYGDGMQRRIWLTRLSNGKEPCAMVEGEPNFYHLHQWGALFCYPFRDYRKRELPDKVINILKFKYKKLEHSGCTPCPVLVLMNVQSEGKRYQISLNYVKKVAEKYGFDINPFINQRRL